MSEHTKGELKRCSPPGLLQINGKTVLCVFPNSCQTIEDIKKREANIERTLLCWNRHDELVKACRRACFLLDQHNIDDEYLNVLRVGLGDLLQKLTTDKKLMEAALAKARKE